MNEILGNIEGISKSTLTNLQNLYQMQLENDCFISKEMIQLLATTSAKINREIALYITRYGEVVQIFIGKSDSVELPDYRLRRSEERLSMIRCIHTHPSASGQLSAVDISALKSLRFDAMCAIGISKDGETTSIQCGFLNNDFPNGILLSPLVSPNRLPHNKWLDAIEESDKQITATQATNEKRAERALLVGIESEESLEELAELAKTAGAITIETCLQKRSKPDSAFCIGRGKAEALSLRCQALDIDVVIFDEVLSPGMQKNLETTLRVKIIDRTALILDIFAGRAQTREGKLQVEVAQLQYRSQHLHGQGVLLSRLAGGIGTRGPGESKLEINRRRIRERLHLLNKELKHMEKQRQLLRQNRTKNRIPIVALVGYTNAGKSTLFNRLTGAEVYVQDQLFATLDHVSRPVSLPHGDNILLIDTVGFIRKLPHEVVNAFRATLEEAKLADLLVIVSDAADPHRTTQYQTVINVLDSLGASDIPRIDALNKIDKLENAELADTLCGEVPIVATTGKGLDKLLSEIEETLKPNLITVTCLIPYDKHYLLNQVHEQGGLLSTTHNDQGTVVTICLQAERLTKLLDAGAIQL